MLNGTSLRKFIAPSPVLSFADETLGAQGNPEIPLSSPFEKREKEGDLTVGAFGVFAGGKFFRDRTKPFSILSIRRGYFGRFERL
jgi:hypothetical protein